jgi:alpha-L-fucosidase
MKKQVSYLIIICLVGLVTCKQVNEPKEEKETGIVYEKYEANWESLKRYKCPEWFKDAKFGIYTHWGPYSVPSWENEWYPRLMYIKDDNGGERFYEHHKEYWGDHSEFGYKDFIPMFKAEKFNAEEWAELFEKSGAQFAGPVAEHHDGFAMWDSDLTEWDANDKGPGRDIVGELAIAVRKRGMKFVTSFHHGFHWKYYEPSYDLENTDTRDPQFAGVDKLYPPIHKKDEPESEEFLKFWLAKVKEVIDKYHPDYLWFDFGWRQPGFEPYKKEFLAYYYNQAASWGKEVVVTYKNEHLPEGVAILDLERGKLDTLSKRNWITDTSVDLKSWSYITEPKYKSINTLVDNLVDRVSKNGNLLLNIGPKPDGTIPEEQKAILLGIGEWLDVNGEAIYGTRPWKIYGEGSTRMVTGHMTERENVGMSYTSEDIRFTTKNDNLYAVCLDFPENGKVTVKSLAKGSDYLDGKVKKVEVLGTDEKIQWKQTDEGLIIEMPSEKPCDFAFVLKFSIK